MSPEKPICNLQLIEPPNTISSIRIAECMAASLRIAEIYGLAQVYQRVSYETGMIVHYTSELEYPIVSLVTLLSEMGLIK